jgi:hypothetical protein
MNVTLVESNTTTDSLAKHSLLMLTVKGGTRSGPEKAIIPRWSVYP